jgi:membrane glycosyltransferase
MGGMLNVKDAMYRRSEPALSEIPVSRIEPDLPQPAPLSMPTQSLWRNAAQRCETSPPASRWLRIGALVAATLIVTGLATAVVLASLGADSLSRLELAVVVVFALLFAWTAFSFFSALAGFFSRAGAAGLRLDLERAPPRLRRRTAVLAPIYNEEPAALFGRLQAIAASLLATGQGARFDIFVLSDTTDEAIRAEEYRCFTRLRGKTPLAVYYRHRPQNTDRKSGNIADWVRRFGGAYETMAVLDADSLMEGETLVRLAAAMEANAGVGLIQTHPMVVNRHNLFARAEQFASRLYGPMLARGTAWWAGGQGNFWGHNAIIRVRAFADQAGLPHLPGRKPFGGHLLSHDFVEAALLRRAGWAVHMVPELGGSYEESPPTLNALIARDRRWCQGNVQHILVLPARGLHLISRLHLLRGVSAYITSPLWLSLVVMGVLLAVKPTLGLSAAAQVPPDAWPTQSLATVGGVFFLAMGFLLGPKALALFEVIASPERRAAFGGGQRAVASVACEIGLSTLIAPVRMLNQTWALFSILAGHDSGWAAQRRCEDGLSFEEAANQHLGTTLIGLILAFYAASASSQALLWVAPVVIGLVASIPTAALTARLDLGLWTRRLGLMITPEELSPPAVLVQANAFAARFRPAPQISLVARSTPEPRGDFAAAEPQPLRAAARG